MSAELTAADIVVTLGGTDVLKGVTLTLSPGRRSGIVGPNGVGKSTLLKAISGNLPLESGSIRVSPPHASVGYLPQEPDRRPGETVGAYLERRTGVAAATAAFEASTEALAAGEPGADDVYSLALDRFLELGAGDLEARAAEMLESLGIGAEIAERPTAELSGGQAARVALAGILLTRFDVLLLDEPTNDLDFDGLKRLEDFVASQRGAVAVVSHDRAFLERVVTDVIALDGHSRTASHFGGGWKGYLEEREIAARHAQERFDDYSSKRDSLKGRAQTQRQWAHKGVAKAKNDSGEKDKTVRNRKVAQSEKQAGKAKATERAMERLEVVEKPWQHWELEMEIAMAPRSGHVVARLTDVVAKRGTFTLGPVTLELNWADRIAIVGANGSGKTTLLDVIQGRLEPSQGTRWMGPGVVVGELGQRRTEFHEDASLIEGFCETTGILAEPARTLLAKFGLRGDHVKRKAASLSPGERTRASLAVFQARGVNALILDEPTNHLDMPAIEQLESALDAYEGTVILVSHDRTLLDHFGPTRTLNVDEGTVTETH